MSRLGKKGIDIPSGVEVKVSGTTVAVKGPKGELTRTFRSSVGIEVSDGHITLVPKKKDKQTMSLWGTYTSHVSNMIQGVSEGFEKKLIIEGVGFRAEVSGKDLKLTIGFSHPVSVPIPEGVTVVVEKGDITVSGIDKEAVGQFASDVRSQKKPEPYKGKGIRYVGEVIRRKEGKKAAA